MTADGCDHPEAYIHDGECAGCSLSYESIIADLRAKLTDAAESQPELDAGDQAAVDTVAEKLRDILARTQPLAKEHAAKVDELFAVMKRLHELGPYREGDKIGPEPTREDAEYRFNGFQTYPQWRRDARDDARRAVALWLEENGL